MRDERIVKPQTAEISIDIKKLLGSNNPEDFYQYLFSIKHTRLEGLVMEYEAEQTLFEEFRKNGWLTLDLPVIRTWQHEKLGTGFWSVEPAGTQNSAVQVELRQYLMDTLRKISLNKDSYMKAGTETFDPDDYSCIHSNVLIERDANQARINAIFWGLARHNPEMFLRSLKNIVIKNHIVVSRLADMDRFLFSPKDKQGNRRIIYLEIKHKYPDTSWHDTGKFDSFSLNVGEIMTIKNLKSVGIECWNIVLCKPIWDACLSPMYLYFDRQAREHAAWLAGNLNGNFVIPGSRTVVDAKTSLNADRPQRVEYLQLPKFSLVGMNSESRETLSQNFYELLVEGIKLEEVTFDKLNGYKIVK